MNKYNDDNYIEAREESIEYKDKNNEEKMLEGLTKVRPEMLDEKAKELFDFIMKKLDELNEYKKVKEKNEKVKEKKVNEMLGENNWKKIDTSTSYYPTKEVFKNNDVGVRMKFDDFNKTVIFFDKNQMLLELDSKELQAINKKVEELGWK